MKIINLAKYIATVIPILILSCNDGAKDGYLDGTTLENITWRIPVNDSLKVLPFVDERWQLPEIPSDIKTVKSYTYFRKPTITKYNTLLGKIDQERLNSSDTDIVQFYRSDNSGMLLVGYTNKDTTKPLTIFDPPVLIQPVKYDGTVVSKSLMKNLSENKLDEGLKTIVTVSPKKRGKYLDSTGKKKNAVLYNLTITRDATIQYGENDLLVPEAIYLSSNIIADDNGILLLEWGIRSMPKTNDKANTIALDSLYIEVTRYKQLTNI